MEAPAYKHCKRCDRNLPLFAFGRNRTSLDGHAFYCKDCFAGIARDRRAAKAALREARRQAEADKVAETAELGV